MSDIVVIPTLSPIDAEIALKAEGFAPGESDVLASSTTNYGQGEGNNLPSNDLYWLLYTKHPTVNACVNIIAKEVCAQGYSIQEGDDDDATPIEANAQMSQDLRDVLNHCWPNQCAVSTWRRALFSAAVDLLVFGHAYWLKKRVKGELAGMERIDPRLVKIKTDRDRSEITMFLVRKLSDRGAGIQNDLQVDKYPAKDVVYFCQGGGDSLLGAPSPLEALDQVLAMDLSIRKFREAFFRNGARAGIFLFNKSADERQVKAAMAMLERTKSRAENAYKAVALTGDWTIQNVANSGKDEFDFVKGSELNREEVMSVYHVPPGKLLFSKGALGSAGKGEDDATFEEQAVLPVEESIYETITDQILKDEFELDNIRMVPKRRSKVKLELFDSSMNLVKFGGTGNEARNLVGLTPIDDPKFQMDNPLFLGQKQPIDQQVGEGAAAPTSQGQNTPELGQAQTQSKQQGKQTKKAFEVRLRRLERIVRSKTT